MNTPSIESMVAEYAANKAEADRLTARNADLADMLLARADFKPGSDTGRLKAAGYKVSITRRINEKWDQQKLEAARRTMTDDLFLRYFKTKYEPDRTALKSFFRSDSSADLKGLIRDACTASAGKPGVKLERMEGGEA